MAPDRSLRLARLLEHAEADLQVSTNGAPLCKVSTTGVQGQGVKYFEGRWAALREVHRGQDARETFHQWRRQFEKHRDQGSSDAWIHYYAGGVDALFELLED